MRAIAADLGVEAPSLYKHIANKDEILDGLCEKIYDEVRIEDVEDVWDLRLRAYGHAFRNALLANRNVVPILATRPLATEGSLVTAELALTEFVRFGFDLADGRKLVNIISATIIGHVLAEIGGDNLIDTSSRFAQIRNELPNDALPLSSMMINRHHDREGEFELILDMMVGGIARAFNKPESQA